MFLPISWCLDVDNDEQQLAVERNIVALIWGEFPYCWNVGAVMRALFQPMTGLFEIKSATLDPPPQGVRTSHATGTIVFQPVGLQPIDKVEPSFHVVPKGLFRATGADVERGSSDIWLSLLRFLKSELIKNQKAWFYPDMGLAYTAGFETELQIKNMNAVFSLIDGGGASLDLGRLATMHDHPDRIADRPPNCFKPTFVPSIPALLDGRSELLGHSIRFVTDLKLEIPPSGEFGRFVTRWTRIGGRRPRFAGRKDTKTWRHVHKQWLDGRKFTRHAKNPPKRRKRKEPDVSREECRAEVREAKKKAKKKASLVGDKAVDAALRFIGVKLKSKRRKKTGLSGRLRKLAKQIARKKLRKK